MKYLSIRKKAFASSLVELATVFAISGIVMAGAISVVDGVMSNSMATKNVEKIKKIDKAIMKFFETNQRLPCPADPTVNNSHARYGIEMLTTNVVGSDNYQSNKYWVGHCYYKMDNYRYKDGTKIISQPTVDASFYTTDFRYFITKTSCSTVRTIGSVDYYSCTGTTDRTIPMNSIIFGTIPYKALGLLESDMYDAYGNKFTYSTMSYYASKRDIATNEVLSRMKWGMVELQGSTALNLSFGVTNTSNDRNGVMMHRDLNLCNSRGINKRLITLFNPGKDSSGNENTVMMGGYSASHFFIDNCNFGLDDYNGNSIIDDEFGYSLISHGKNGQGAWNRDGIVNNIDNFSSTNPTKEQLNTFRYYITKYPSNLLNTNNFIHFVADDKYIDFDDIVTYKTISEVLNECSLTDLITCHHSTAFKDFIDSTTPNSMDGCYWPSGVVNGSTVSPIKQNYFKSNYAACSASQAKCISGGNWLPL